LKPCASDRTWLPRDALDGKPSLRIVCALHIFGKVFPFETDRTYIGNRGEFFDATAGAVVDACGDTLGFVGDGFLAFIVTAMEVIQSEGRNELALSVFSGKIER